MKLASVLMDILAAAGVRYLFGNPGTTELTFLDALPGSRLEYVVGLQEATAVSAADGYAQASGHVGIANVHVAPGVANALSALHNASRAKSPLVLTAGQQDSRFLLDQPILSGDLVQLTEQLTKWSFEVRRAEEAPMALRRALKVARTPPTGPVFLSLPMDLMTGEVDDDGSAAPTVTAAAPPDPPPPAPPVHLLPPPRTPPHCTVDRRRARRRSSPEAVAGLPRLSARSRCHRRAALPAHQLSGNASTVARRSLSHRQRRAQIAGDGRHRPHRRGHCLRVVPAD